MRKTRIIALCAALAITAGVFTACRAALAQGGFDRGAQAFDARQFLTWYYEEGPWRSPVNRWGPSNWVTGFSENPADRPTYEDIETIMNFASLAMSARARTPWYMVVVTDYETQVLLHQADRPGTPRGVSRGTVKVLIFSEWLLYEDVRTDTVMTFFPREGYINAGIMSAYINMAAIALGYSVRQYMTLSHPWPALGERWSELEFLLDGRFYTWGSTGERFNTENMKFANALVIGRLDPTVESGTTVALRPHNWSFWDPAGSPAVLTPRQPPRAIVLADIPDGVYTGTGRGYYGSITVQVTVANGAITGIHVTDHSETPAFMTLAAGGIIPQILEGQRIQGIDVVTGATAVSEGIINAVTNALRQ
ncbi:MAG: FMN-binding protein [Treponema sp.]|nr:FMN-binding protein [Treponema sp.]